MANPNPGSSNGTVEHLMASQIIRRLEQRIDFVLEIASSDTKNMVKDIMYNVYFEKEDYRLRMIELEEINNNLKLLLDDHGIDYSRVDYFPPVRPVPVQEVAVLTEPEVEPPVGQLEEHEGSRVSGTEHAAEPLPVNSAEEPPVRSVEPTVETSVGPSAEHEVEPPVSPAEPMAVSPIQPSQELYMRRGISPKYDLLQIEGAVHEPTFVYRVTVGEFAANGSGQSKKKAKHAAAKAVLDIIIQGGAASTGGPTTGGPPGAPPELSTQIVSPYDDGIPGNPVGSLQELCMARRWPPPTYELTSEEGFPHERTFSIACTIGTTKEVGTGKSKKLAKRQAAYKMTQRLKDQPVEQPQVNVLADDDDEIAQKLAARYSGLKDSKVLSLNTSDSRKVSHFHKNLKQSPGKKLLELQTMSLNNINLNFTQILQDVAQEANFVVTYVDIEELSISGQHQCLVQLSTMPVAVCYGTGPSLKEAQSSAAHNALEYLKIMTCK